MMLKSKLAPLAGAPQPFDQILHQAGQVIFGKGTEIRLAVACLLANGHLLIEDLPGMGKTTLAHTLARLLGLQFSRIQFTSDLLPADITGVSIFERDKSAFRFLPGPVFAQLVLADEINRATPKTQSALLEAMEEGQVTAEGQTHTLPRPFFVIATQNPMHQIGTFPLPESQLDRFLMRIELGYPDRTAERALLEGGGRRQQLPALTACLAPDAITRLQAQASAVHAAPALLDYVQNLISATRSGRWFVQGLSPRAGIALVRAAKARALLEGRTYVAPDDVQAVLAPCIAHRLVPVGDARRGAVEQVRAMADSVPLP